MDLHNMAVISVCLPPAPSSKSIDQTVYPLFITMCTSITLPNCSTTLNLVSSEYLFLL
jgi:hypothetical protein